MEETTLNTLVGLLCWAALCIVPLGAVAGGIVFFRKRRKPAGSLEPASAAPTVPAAAHSTTLPLNLEDPAPETAAPAPASATVVSTSAAPDAPALAPSEIVWLRGDEFSEPAGVMNSEKLLYKDARVKGPALAAAVLQAAVLALVQSGDAVLQPAKRKVLFKEHDTLNLVPNGHRSNWPAGSYEDTLLQLAAALQAKNDNNIPVLVFRALERDATVPWMQVFSPLKRALAQRGLLSASKGALGLSVKFELAAAEGAPQLTAARIAALDVQPVRSLLSARPDLETLLQREIREGVERRRDTGD